MESASSIDDKYLADAARLLQLVDRPSFRTANAIFAVTTNSFVSNSIDAIKTVEAILSFLRVSDDLNLSIEQRCHAILKLVVQLPNLSPKKNDEWKKIDLYTITFSDFRNPKLSDVFRLIDLPARYLVSSQGPSRAIRRYIDKTNKEELLNSQNGAKQTEIITTMIQQQPAPVSMLLSPQSSSFPSSISPLSMSQASSQQYFKSVDSSVSKSPASLVSNPKLSSLSSSSTSMSDFIRISTLPETRKTSKQSQDDRALETAWKDMQSSAYKIGSLMYKLCLDGLLPLEQFDKDPVNVACAVNNMMGCDLLSGNEIKQCVREDRVGQSPKRKGPNTRIPDDEEEAICTAVYTYVSLQQINCDPNSLSRPQMRQRIMKIVNAALEKRGEQPLNEVKFYDRIQKRLARDVTLTTTNKRDALRTAWCTYEKQKQDYKTFEEAVVDLELGRWSQTKEERREFGNIVLYPGQEYRIMNFDEMGFSYDGCKNGKRGRKAMYHNNKHLPQPGQATNKSAQKNSLICGMNFAFEALPPGIILQSSAVAPRIRTQLLRYMKHVRGQFGHPSVEDPNDVKTFPVFISWSKDSSVTDQIFIEYILHIKTFCYPDAKDVPGYRVLMKADSGPGRMNKEFLAIARSHGFYFLPGLPNGTELGQEMDQVFAEFKGILEENRDLLYKTLFSLPADEN